MHGPSWNQGVTHWGYVSQGLCDPMQDSERDDVVDERCGAAVDLQPRGGCEHEAAGWGGPHVAATAWMQKYRVHTYIVRLNFESFHLQEFSQGGGARALDCENVSSK